VEVEFDKDPPPETDQLTPPGATSFMTEAVRGKVCDSVRPPRSGEMVTLSVRVVGCEEPHPAMPRSRNITRRPNVRVGCVFLDAWVAAKANAK
jgi:hypothetical protein